MHVQKVLSASQKTKQSMLSDHMFQIFKFVRHYPSGYIC